MGELEAEDFIKGKKERSMPPPLTLRCTHSHTSVIFTTFFFCSTNYRNYLFTCLHWFFQSRFYRKKKCHSDKLMKEARQLTLQVT